MFEPNPTRSSDPVRGRFHNSNSELLAFLWSHFNTDHTHRPTETYNHRILSNKHTDQADGKHIQWWSGWCGCQTRIGAQSRGHRQIQRAYPGWQYRRATMGETTQGLSLLTLLCIVPAAAIAANVLYLFPDVTVNRKGHVVVVVVVRMLAVPFLAAQGHYFDQAERFFLRFLHGHGRVFSAPRGKPSTVHDGGCRIHRRVIGRLEHWDAERRSSAPVRDVTTAWVQIKGPSIQSYLPSSKQLPSAVFPHLYLRSRYVQATRLRNVKVAAAAEKKPCYQIQVS